ncbi:phosphatase PAP2 family protein [Streptomyces bohaiensis]|uniref:Phosphatase PAP2 family protein n=2 Tax=Streptomyces bohaiensis TaxID=1431344 RepID=A0ABX1CIB7_9ACTN|nr:phosphatase PAP2 family protein [Streptomyces bohaiensis]NJQ16912.1 phosphatase PAP2 family protein [Streptomyces bohaiensis]
MAAPDMSRVRMSLLGTTAVFYAAIVGLVLTTSWLVHLDWQVMLFRPYKQWPELHAFLDYFVVLGQRGPTAALIAAWLGWRSWRQRTLRPLLVMGCALLLLNLSVGAAKLGMGREGPHYANIIGSNEMFLTGDIFPSGHTANAVVTWGILAYLATTPQARRILSVIAAVFALGVGTTTVYLGTHWVSDVLLGWAAGLLILLALPWFEPLLARVEMRLLTDRDRLWERFSLREPKRVPAVRPVTVGVRTGRDGDDARETEAAPALNGLRPARYGAHPYRAPTGPRPSGPPSHPGGAHPTAHPGAGDRPPVSPAGSH